MDDGPPPPPPPHGENPHTTEGEYRKASDMPPGNYDIFIIPPHSAGSGFLYLPSLQCHRNSFIAGVASTLSVFFVWSMIAPYVKTWYIMATMTVGGNNNIGTVVVALGVGVAGWAFGMSQNNSNGENGGKRFGGGFGGFGGFGSFGGGSGGQNSQSQSSGGNYGHGTGQQQQQQQQHGGKGGSGQQQHQQQRQQGGNYGGGPNRGGNQYARQDHGPGPDSGTPPKPDNNNHGPNGDEWEKAREETKRKEELKRKMEEFRRKREAEAKEKERKREREAMEKELKERREQLEREMAAAREKAEREAREKAEKEARELRERAERDAKEARERAEKEAAEARAKLEKAAAEAKAEAERREAEAKEKAAKEAAEKAAAEKAAAQKEAMAKFAALKEAAAKRYAEKKAQESKKEKEVPPKAGSATGTPRTPSPKKPPFPTAKTTIEDDAYSFRPYDRPRRPYGQASGSSAYSESSYAPSQSTARTTPPPSHRGTYSTKDPDKIVILGVYQFTNAFMKTPVAQLVSGQGMVTDGLVLRITTEGLFVDDDVRGVGQREWDVKAWTLKLTEVWCPQMGKPQGSKQQPSINPFSFRRSGAAHSVPTNEESDAFTTNLLKVCKNTCRLASPSAGGLHVLRASLRDQEGKRYVFVLQDTEAWKVAIGLQRIRGGALVRALGVTALPAPDCKTILSNLGYT
ncbi:Reticulocyte-binding protein [Penicillium rolfsii]|nr:Reticulocyte-binding protein [Penicillium rolfsii]